MYSFCYSLEIKCETRLCYSFSLPFETCLEAIAWRNQAFSSLLLTLRPMQCPAGKNGVEIPPCIAQMHFDRFTLDTRKMRRISRLHLQSFLCFSGIIEIIPAGTESGYLIQLRKIKFSTKIRKQASVKLGFYLHKNKWFRAVYFLCSPMHYWRLQPGFFSHPPIKASESCHPAFLNFDSFAPTLWWICWLACFHLSGFGYLMAGEGMSAAITVVLIASTEKSSEARRKPLCDGGQGRKLLQTSFYVAQTSQIVTSDIS